jgi:hypothetical protein
MKNQSISSINQSFINCSVCRPLSRVVRLVVSNILFELTLPITIGWLDYSRFARYDAIATTVILLCYSSTVMPVHTYGQFHVRIECADAVITRYAHMCEGTQACRHAPERACLCKKQTSRHAQTCADVRTGAYPSTRRHAPPHNAHERVCMHVRLWLRSHLIILIIYDFRGSFT